MYINAHTQTFSDRGKERERATQRSLYYFFERERKRERDRETEKKSERERERASEREKKTFYVSTYMCTNVKDRQRSRGRERFLSLW